MKCIRISIVLYLISLNGYLTNAFFWNYFFDYYDPKTTCTFPKKTNSVKKIFNDNGNGDDDEPDLEKLIKFKLYTREDPKEGDKLSQNDEDSIKKSSFDPKKPIRIIIPGFLQKPNTCDVVYIRKAYLKKGDFNVIVMDWSKMAKKYFITGYVVRLIASQLNDLTRMLYQKFLVSYRNMYLIGIDVGAHIAGMAGRGKSDEQYDTIFGLDPASKTGYMFKDEDMLGSHDAFYVETIHTNMGQLGVDKPSGFSSIFPDYGREQKICNKKSPSSRKKCHHRAAVLYFARSINRPQCVKARRCNNMNNINQKNCQCSGSQDCNVKYRLGGEPSEKKQGLFYGELKCKKKKKKNIWCQIIGCIINFVNDIWEEKIKFINSIFGIERRRK